MSTNLNQIDELRKRASVSYTDAKEALEKCDGILLDALVYLEKNNKSQSAQNCPKTGLFDKVGALLKKGSSTRLIMHKQDRTVFNLSINVAILIAIITLPFIELIAIGALIALFTGHRFKLLSSFANTEKINQVFDKMSNAAEDIKERLSDNKTEPTDTTNK